MTKQEKAAVADCIERELDKFSKDEKLQPERIKLLTSALNKLNFVLKVEEGADAWSYD